MAGDEARALAQQVAERVQEAVEAAERRAEEIVARAEHEAGRIRARAEDEARDRIERAQDAVDRLVGQADELRNALGGEAKGGAARSETPAPEAPEVDPTPATVPEPEPAREPEPSPPTTPEPEPAREPEPQPPEVPEPVPPSGDAPSTEQLIAQLKGGNASSDEGAARLVAMNMALDGKSREEVESHLAEGYELDDVGTILDEVYSRVGG
jgi:hypothetical protein